MLGRSPGRSGTGTYWDYVSYANCIPTLPFKLASLGQSCISSSVASRVSSDERNLMGALKNLRLEGKSYHQLLVKFLLYLCAVRHFSLCAVHLLSLCAVRLTPFMCCALFPFIYALCAILHICAVRHTPLEIQGSLFCKILVSYLLSFCGYPLVLFSLLSLSLPQRLSMCLGCTTCGTSPNLVRCTHL